MFEQIEEREAVVDHEANVGDECEEAIGAVVTIEVESEGGKVVALRLLLLGHVINRNNYSLISVSLYRPAAHYSTSHRRELAAALTLSNMHAWLGEGQISKQQLLQKKRQQLNIL
ncbi:hypothetical protein PS2_003274 [Malus domestica]